MRISDAAQGLIELLEEVSHDPDEADWYDVEEYIGLLPNTTRVLRELAHYMHENYL